MKLSNQQDIKPHGETQLCGELMRVWDQLGRRPTYSEFKIHGKIKVGAYERYYGSWTNAVVTLAQLAGKAIQGTSFTNINPQVLLAELAEVQKKNNNDILQYKDYKNLGGTYSIGTFRLHFKSWKKAVEQVGLKSGHSRARPDLRHFSDEDYFAEMQRLWDKLGKQPTWPDMRKHGNISPQAFGVRFGRWLLAVEAFKKYRNLSDSQSKASAESTEAKFVNVIEGITRESIILSRSRSAVLRDEALRLSQGICEACGINFQQLLDGQGCHVLQVHHKKQLALLEIPEATSIADLAVVCANCHTIIHSDMCSAMPLDELKEMWRRQYAS